ncbi:MAG: chromate efflux transporter [Rickettsiales bacterium]
MGDKAVVPASIPSIILTFLKIGCLGFGGPAGQIALMHRMIVEEKKWLDENRFGHALSFCMLLPGPEAQQLATYIGWILHGVKGGLIAGILFVLPGALLIFALSVFYVHAAETTWLQGVLFGLKAAVVAIVIDALLRLCRRTLKSSAHYALAILSYVAIAFFDVPFPLLVVLAGITGYGCFPVSTSEPVKMVQAKWSKLAAALCFWSIIWLLPLASVYLLYGTGHILTAVSFFFSKLAVITFGGAYAVLAYMSQAVVNEYHWLSTSQMLHAFGLAETTPGPLILVNQFVAFLAGFQHASDHAPLMTASIAALLCLWATFVPSFLFIFAFAPYVEQLRTNARLSGALQAILSMVVGVVAYLAYWFALHVFFTSGRSLDHRMFHAYIPDIDSFQPDALILSLVALILLVPLRLNMLLVLLLVTLLGVGIYH